MSYEIRADYSQQLLLPVSVEDWVGRDHPARFIREVVDGLDLVELGFPKRVSFDGRPNYASDLLVKVWLYGYMNAIRSPRKLERASREHMGLIWLTGRNAADHNSLWRFWRDYRRELRRMIRAVSRLALRHGLIEVVLHAVDGTKVVAQASKDGVWRREKLEKELGLLDAAIEEVMEEIDQKGVREQGMGGYRLPEQWEEAFQKREHLRELLAEVEEEERAQVHPLEAKARLGKTRSSGTTLTHNAQAVVDSKSGLIVASDVIEENSDNHALVQMIEEAKENLGEAAEQTVADAGYYSGEELERARERGFEVLVHEQNAEPREAEQSEYHHSRFRYDAGRDCCVCPRGEDLRFEREKADLRRDRVVRVYRCKAYRECPVRWQCSKDPRGRTMVLSRHHKAIVAQREKQRDPAMKALLKKRASIVELPFAVIKEAMGFRRFTVGGMSNVRTQWALVCVGYNLRRMFQVWRAGHLVI